MMSTLRLLFLLLLTSTSACLHGQGDTIFRPSARLGFDVSGLARRFFEPESRALEFSADWEWRKNWFLALEGGGMAVDIEKDTHSYEAGGWFFRLGADYNFLQRPDPVHQDLVIALIRYGFGSLNHQAPGIRVSNPYWGDYFTEIPSERFLAHWLELGGGLKTRIGKHLFMGWTLRARFLISQSRESLISPYTISGFGRHSGNTSVGIHYFLYYRIPF